MCFVPSSYTTGSCATSSADPAWRAADADRERTIEALRMHAGAGRLGVDELDARIGAAAGARTLGDLRAVVADLPPVTVDADRHVEAALARIRLRDHVRVYVAVNVLLVAIWALAGAGHMWVVWPLLGWGIALAAQALGHPSSRRGHRNRGPLRV